MSYSRLYRWIGLCLLTLGLLVEAQAAKPCQQDTAALRRYQRWTVKAILNNRDSVPQYLAAMRQRLDTTCPDKFWQSQFALTQGQYYTQSGDHKKALEVLAPALKLALRTRQDSGQVALMRRLYAVALVYTSQYDLALEQLEEAYKYQSRHQNYKSMAGLSSLMAMTLGMVMSSPNRLELVRELYYRAIKEAEMARDTSAGQWIRNNLAIVEYHNKNYPEAQRLAEENLRYFSRVNDLVGKASALENLALLAEKRKDYAQAITLMKEATTLMVDQNPNEAMFPWYSLAKVYFGAQRHREARDFALKSYNQARQMGNIKHAFESAYLVSETWREQGNASEAFRWLVLHNHLKDSLINVDLVARLEQFTLEQRLKQTTKELQLNKQVSQLQKATIRDQTFIQRLLIGGFLLLLGVVAGTIWVARNIRRKKDLLERQAATIAEQNRELANLNRTRQEFFSIIAHDLRGPISNFTYVPDLIQQYLDGGNRSGLEQLLDVMRRSFSGVNNLLENLLAWSMSQTGAIPYQPKEVEIEVLRAQVQNLFQESLVLKEQSLRTQIEPGLKAWADEDALNTIVRNLVSNAIKFTPRGGHIELEAHRQNGHVELTVSDTGVGIQPEKLTQLFEPGHRRSQGTQGETGVGLGLALVHELVRLNQGHIVVDSHPGQGTKVTVMVPAYQQVA